MRKKGEALTLEDAREWGKEKRVKTIVKAPALFPRIEKKGAKGEIGTPPKKEAREEGKSMISFKEFQKIDLRVGTVRKAEAIPGSKKLLKLTVDVGDERTVVAGLVGHYNEVELQGKQVLVLTNLEPVKLIGIESRGMVLAAEDGDNIRLLMPDGNMSPGSKVK